MQGFGRGSYLSVIGVEKSLPFRDVDLRVTNPSKTRSLNCVVLFFVLNVTQILTKSYGRHKMLMLTNAITIATILQLALAV